MCACARGRDGADALLLAWLCDERERRDLCVAGENVNVCVKCVCPDDVREVKRAGTWGLEGCGAAAVRRM